MKIKKLTKKVLQENIDDLMKIDQVIDEENHWEYENFFIELYGKWDNSYIALKDEFIQGFIVCSIKNKNRLHIHRLAVKKESQSTGVGAQLINEVINSRSNDIRLITLKVNISNKIAQSFYTKFGFELECLEGDYSSMRLII